MQIIKKDLRPSIHIEHRTYLIVNFSAEICPNLFPGIIDNNQEMKIFLENISGLKIDNLINLRHPGY